MAAIKFSNGKSVEMRKPKVRDVMAVKDIINPMDNEVALIGNLTEMTQEEIYDLDLADYLLLQKELSGFKSSEKKT